MTIRFCRLHTPQMLMRKTLNWSKEVHVYCFFNQTTIFSCANIIAKGFSNDQLAFYNDKLGLANTTCHWNTGVMVADNEPLYGYEDITLEISCFQLQ